MSEVRALADRLRSVLDDLDQLAFDRLREAVANGATSRPPGDKELATARRSVAKALHVLDAIADADDT